MLSALTVEKLFITVGKPVEKVENSVEKLKIKVESVESIVK